jgi:Carboxypeptidase regulatory-like domain/TonB dependent receptor-like, beta-barrel
MKLFNLALCAALSGGALYAQTALATVTGTITDSTGAVIANAPVTLKNLENGQVSTAASSAAGNFTVSQLPIGDYDLTATVPGFKTYTHSKFHLAANQIMRENVVMEIGQATEAVTVTAETSLLKTENSELAQNVTLSQLNNLPVLIVGSTNNGFRDPFASVGLVPGIRYNGGSNIGAGNPAAITSMVINGTPSNTYQARLDGMTINPTGPRLIGAQMETQPSVDAIQEVAIQTSNFAAEFGTAGGATINMVTKSGTNQYHGSAYDYITNEALNAHQPYTGTRNLVKQHDWGYTVGGPVWFPKIYDGRNKTFFFWSYEQFRNKNINVSNTTTVPLPAYRTGDFSSLITVENRLITTASGPAKDALGRTMASGTIFDPNTQQVVNGRAVRDPFPGNKFAVGRFDPIAAKILALVPQPLGPNAASGQASNNYQGTFDSSRVSAVPSIKIDQNVGSKGRLSFYYQDTHTAVPRTPTGADAFGDLITGSSRAFNSGQTIRLNYDHAATTRLLLHGGLGWNDSDFGLEAPITNYDAFKELGLSGQTLARYFPRVVTAVNSNTAIGGMSSLGDIGPTRSFERRPSWNASATYVTGGHTLKFGAEYRRETFPNVIKGNTQGTYTFGANMTEQPSLQGVSTNQGFDGFEFASFLLGGMSANSVNAPIGLANIKSQTAVYVQDSWKVTRKLTLDYGVRWDYGTYAHEQYGRNSSLGLLIPNPSASGRLGGSQFEATCKCNFANNYPYAIGPRIGVAYKIDSKTVLRAGIGVVYNSTSTASGSAAAAASSNTLPPNAGQITGLFKDGTPASVHPVWPSFVANVNHAVGSVITMPTYLDPNAGRPARLLQWNIGLQREITRNLVVEASYVGNRGVWWTATSLPPVNFLGQDILTSHGFKDFTSVDESRLLTTTVSSLTPAQRSTLAARGVTGLPYANFPSNQTVRQSLLPFPQYSQQAGGFFATVTGSPLGDTWYNAFQLSVTQRFTHGLSFNMNYNYSKSLELMNSPDVFNRSLGKDLGLFDLPHQLRLTAQYQVPRLRESGKGVFSNKIASAILSDWGVGVYLSYQSAPVVSRPSSNGTVPISQFLGYGPGAVGCFGCGAQLKKGTDGNSMNPWSVDWTDYSGTHHTDPIDINCHCFDPTKTVVLNPSAWENVPNGQFAADTSTLRFYRGFRTPTENANFSRNFRITERVQLNVRVEFNNIFNRLQYGSLTNGTGLTPFNLGNFASAPTTFKTGATAGLYSGGFGTIVPLAGTNGMRTGTLIARITF